MTKFMRNESMNMFRDHVDQEKEQLLKQNIIETDTKVEKIVKLVKSANSGNKEAKLKKRSEAILLIEDFYKQYQSMCTMYQDLRENVKKKCNDEPVKLEDNESSTSSCSSSNLLSMESSAYHSPNSGSKTPSIDQLIVKEPENNNLENKSPSKMKVLEERFNALKLEIETLNCPRSEYEHEWKGRHDDFHKKDRENSGFRVLIAIKEKESDVLKKLDEFEKFLEGKIDKSIDRVHGLQTKVDSLRSQNESRLEKDNEFELLRVRNQEAETELEKKTNEAADFLELLQQKTKTEAGLVEETNSLKTRIRDLELKLKSLEIEKSEVAEKNDVLSATLEQKDALMSKSNHEAKSSFKASVKKMSEMVDEFRFKTEDSIRILSRRIRVAEQLHNETRDWYKKTITKHEQDRRDNELAFHSVKIITSMVSETLTVSETFGLRFVECCEDFSNRVSKVSCESKFVKDWVKRKNGVIVQVKDDFDKLVVRLDDKEEEILGSRQKVLKLETRLREIEKIVKENEESLIVLKEEKREAIRQLCVWIDYHRNRYDSIKKAFTEFVARNHRPGYL